MALSRREFIRNTFLAGIGLKLGVQNFDIDFAFDKFVHEGTYSKAAFKFFRPFVEAREDYDYDWGAVEIVSVGRVWVPVGRNRYEQSKYVFATRLMDELRDNPAAIKEHAKLHRRKMIEAFPKGTYRVIDGKCIQVS